jgi:hypothetical protein
MLQKEQKSLPKGRNGPEEYEMALHRPSSSKGQTTKIAEDPICGPRLMKAESFIGQARILLLCLYSL